MAKWTPAPIVGGAYSDDTRPWSVQDCVNYIPVMAERGGTRSGEMLRGAPGLVAYQAIGTGPIRGAHNAEGRLFIVSGRTLYNVTARGVGVPIGTIPGVGRVSFAHNQIAGANEVVVANGQGAYVYNTATGAFGPITDSGFPGAKVVGFLDGYIMFVEPAGRYWGTSDLAAATEYNTLDRSEAESQPDRIVSGIVNNGEWIVLGERTIEFFGNTGAATGTFQRAGTPIGSIGCAGTFAVAQTDNTVFWLGNDGIIYRLNGYTPQRISTHPIEQAISRFNRRLCFATVYEDRGHKIVYFTFPDGLTFGYDVSSGEWHRRASYGLDRWRLNTLTRWNGQWVGGDYSSNRLYTLDWDTYNEAGEPLVARRTSGVLHDSENPITVNAVKLVMNPGIGGKAVPGFPVQPTGPTISGAAPSGSVGIPYAGHQYTVTPGDAPIASVRIVSGVLPDGLTMSNGGLIDTGTPTQLDSFPITVRVTDTNGLFADLDDTIVIGTVFFIAETGVNPLFISAGGVSWSNEDIVTTGLVTDTRLLYSADSRIYAVGVGGEGVYSEDSGGSWLPVSGLQATSQIAGMTFTGSRWIAINATTSGGARISIDGVTFVGSPFPVDRTVKSIASNGDVVVVTTTAGLIIRSIDGGGSWTEFSEADLTGTPIIAYGNGMFVAAFVNEAKIATSPTGAEGTWTLRTNPSVNPATGLAFGNGLFVITTNAGEPMVSDDGITWSLGEPLGIDSSSVAFGPNLFVLVGLFGSIFSSADGVTWTPSARPSNMGVASAVAGVNP